MSALLEQLKDALGSLGRRVVLKVLPPSSVRWVLTIRGKLAEADRLHLAVAEQDAGDWNRTEALVRDFERSPGDSPGRVRNYLRSLSRASVLGMRTETLPQALTAYRRLPGVCGYCVHFKMAEAFDRSAMQDSAMVYYQRWADDAEGNWAPLAYTVWQPVGWFRMAELYQAKGDKERARYYYGRFINNWKDADPGLQPKVREARRRMAELVAEPAN